MARIFITGSADGLGQLSARSLIQQGHSVVLHARNNTRGKDAMKQNPGAETVLMADLSQIDEIINLAQQVNATGNFDAVIHNAGVYAAPAKEMVTVNVLAPYILTCLIQKPKRLIYLSSGLHLQGHAKLSDLENSMHFINYSDTKLLVVLLCMATARLWKNVYANAVNPGWVPTKMGGPGAPDNLAKGYATQTWLAACNDENAAVSGRYFFHQKEKTYNAEAADSSLQQKFLETCARLTNVSFPSM
jgi:NAD(P)-dependent dehydrogenase (short-subunit alcohol dehydrogenase family)